MKFSIPVHRSSGQLLPPEPVRAHLPGNTQRGKDTDRRIQICEKGREAVFFLGFAGEHTGINMRGSIVLYTLIKGCEGVPAVFEKHAAIGNFQ